MSYHRFPNLRELLQGDLQQKLWVGIGSLDFETLKCNCQPGATEPSCKYNNVCRHPLVVYQAKCTTTGKCYIGNTQQHLKTRMQQHANDTRQKKLFNKNSDTFASHFADQMRNFVGFSHILHRNMYKLSVLWQANPIQAIKSFGTPRCVLCTRERLEILKLHRHSPQLLINHRTEIYGACRHKARFHRYMRHTDSTDDTH
jgi:GIY-YIG catalytic domain